MGHLDQFAELVDILDRCGVAWWAQSGTLLGLYREGRLLPWDKDIDIDGWAVHPDDDTDPWGAVEASLRGAGYKVRKHAHRGMLVGLTGHRRGSLPVHIHLWRRTGAEAWAVTLYMAPNSFRPPDPRWLAWGAFRRALGLLWWRTTLLNRHVRIERAAAHLGLRVGTWSMPAELLDTVRLAVDGVGDVAIPADADRVLTMHYGDWRTPRREWNYRIDDPTFSLDPPPAGEPTRPMLSRRGEDDR